MTASSRVRSVLVVDAANVVGARPDGWWRDRAGAARRLHEALVVADTTYDEIVLVLEGEAKAGVAAGRDGHVRTVHARGSGDDAIVQQTRAACQPTLAAGARVTVVTADRLLRARVVRLGATVMSPLSLLDEVI